MSLERSVIKLLFMTVQFLVEFEKFDEYTL